MENKTISSNFFYGNEVSQYGQQHGYVDYRTLARAFDAVMVNDITKLFYCDINGEWNEPEYYNGSEYWTDEDGNEYYNEIYQYYIIDGNGADLLQVWTDEIVYYLPALNMYIWGVTHCGTSWDYVLTDIKINMEDQKNEIL